MINPLDLSGPHFLLFYVAVGAAVLVSLRALLRVAEGGPAPRLDLSDPYLVAYLRGGKNEALRIAAVALIDRGLLEIDAKDNLSAKPGAADIAARPVERALLRHFEDPRAATDIFQSDDLERACDPYRAELGRRGLLPDDAARESRRLRLGVALVVLIGLAAAKIWVALSRGRTNVGFLVILAVIFAIAAVKSSQPFRTAKGTALLGDLRRLFRRLRERAGTLRPGAATSEVALLAAVFGLAALPAHPFAYARRLYPRAAKAAGSSCGSMAGASCGSGGGCGGGGGGGGCGGCGGGGGGD